MLGALAEIVFDIVFRVVCVTTGHVALAVLTLGHWKAFENSDTTAELVGVLLYAVVIVGVAVILSR